jgi:hypothetical protein
MTAIGHHLHVWRRNQIKDVVQYVHGKSGEIHNM